MEIAHAFLNLNSVPGAVQVGRIKPWGIGQAVLVAKDLIHEPFAVINADDYYGKEAYRQMHDWLVLDHVDNIIAMLEFILKRWIARCDIVVHGNILVG